MFGNVRAGLMGSPMPANNYGTSMGMPGVPDYTQSMQPGQAPGATNNTDTVQSFGGSPGHGMGVPHPGGSLFNMSSMGGGEAQMNNADDYLTGAYAKAAKQNRTGWGQGSANGPMGVAD